MSSKNKTPLGLSQWEGTDVPQRLDFNSDNLLVDTILQKKANVVDGKVFPMPSVGDVGGSNPNLLDNWYFGPGVINQRGQTVYSSGYSIDRWALMGESGSVTIQGGFISVRHSGQAGIWQTIEMTRMNAGVYTLSVDCMSSPNIKIGVLVNGEWHQTILTSLTRQIHKYTFTISKPTTNISVMVAFSESDSQNPIYLYAIKLELGPNQTLAHQDANGNWVLSDPPPNPALELMKCQRYFQPISNDNLGYGATGSNNKVYIGISIPTTMRTTPAVVIPNAVTIKHSNTVVSGCIYETVHKTAGNIITLRFTAPEGVQLPTACSCMAYTSGAPCLDANL